MKILITGTAGFIGHALAKKLLTSSKKNQVYGIDNFDRYYSKGYKKFRLSELLKHKNFQFSQGSITSKSFITQAISKFQPDVVIHTAAKVGVSAGEENSTAYIKTNILGSSILLEVLQQFPPQHLIFFSSSSVYGSFTINSKKSLTEDLAVTLKTPLSIYGLTKASAESLAQRFALQTKVPTTVLRPFSVYGPYGRPDMLPLKTIAAAVEGNVLPIFDSKGKIARDWTYIDDLVSFVSKLAIKKTSHSFEVVNIGSGKAVDLQQWLTIMKKYLKKSGLSLATKIVSSRNFESHFNQANTAKAQSMGYVSATPLEKGLGRTVDFFLKHPEFL